MGGSSSSDKKKEEETKTKDGETDQSALLTTAGEPRASLTSPSAELEAAGDPDGDPGGSRGAGGAPGASAAASAGAGGGPSVSDVSAATDLSHIDVDVGGQKKPDHLVVDAADELHAAPAPAPSPIATASAEGASSIGASSATQSQSAASTTAPPDGPPTVVAPSSSSALAAAGAGGDGGDGGGGGGGGDADDPEMTIGDAYAAATASSDTEADREAAAARAAARSSVDVTDFTMIKTIGQGSFGTVLQVRKNDDGNIFAMKVLKKERVLRRKQYEHTLSERRILENIDHPFIVSLRFAFQTEHKLYMVFDFFNGGELFNYLSTGGAFSEARARFYAAEILLGLEYLHDRGIVYRDLKAENIVLDSTGHVRITDFGLAKDGVEGDSITSICGTPEYLAPEVIRRRPYGAAVDWWSLGTLLYEMLAGFPPYYDRNRQVMYRKILTAEMSPPAEMSPDAVDLCRRMLAREPKERLGYRSAADIKAHPFFKGLDWDKLLAKEVPPPWVPRVSNAEDVSLISSQWTTREPRVTASPEGSTLRDTMGVQQTPPSFGGFTFVHESVFGATYRVSISSSEDDLSDRELSDRGSGVW